RGITHINRGGPSLLRTLEEELAHIQENRIRFQRGEQNDNKRKSLSASLERSRFALERWQGICRRWLLSQRADGSGSRPDEGELRNHLRQPQRQHAANGCPFSCSRLLRWRRGQASGLSKIPRHPDRAQKSNPYLGYH